MRLAGNAEAGEGYKQTSVGLAIMAQVAGEVRREYGYGSYITWINDKFGLSEATGLRLLRIYNNILSTVNLTVDETASLSANFAYLENIAPAGKVLKSSSEDPGIALVSSSLLTVKQGDFSFTVANRK